MINLIFVILVAVFWRLGGWNKAGWTGWRDVCIPVIACAYISFDQKNLLVGIACGVTLNIIRLGYGAYDPVHDPKPSLLASVTHDSGGWWIRGIVGVLYVLVGLLPLAIHTHHWLPFVAWSVASGVAGWVFCRLKAPDFVIEPAIGAVLALSVIFF